MINNIVITLKLHFLKHRCLYIILGLFLFVFGKMLTAMIITPIRYKMWEGKEVDILLTPEEWRKLSGVEESLKETEWVHYTNFEGKSEKDPFFIKNKGLYQPFMYFNGNKHFLRAVNSKYPYLNSYTYINPTKIFGHDTFIIYDQRLKKVLIQYNMITGYFRNNFFSGDLDCNEHSISGFYEMREKYFH